MLLVSHAKSESAITTTSWNADCPSSNNLSSILVLNVLVDHFVDLLNSRIGMN